MHVLRLEREVAAPAHRVWALLTDIEGWAEILSAVRRVRRLDDREAFGVGTRWCESRRVLGREVTEELWVSAVDPGRSYTVEADSHGGHFRTTLAVEPLGGDASRIELAFRGRARGAFGRLLGVTVGRLLEGTLRHELQRDLDDFARAAEEGRVAG